MLPGRGPLPVTLRTMNNRLQKKPKLGQNFLVDDTARHRIADALGDISQSTVLEIGPGHGSITTILAERAQRLICVELDRSLAAELRFRFRNHSNVEILEADILQTDLTALIGSAGKADIIGNLPYYITSDILLHLAAHAGSIRLAIVMMQREVADRVAAQPGTRDYGLLSVTVQMSAAVNALFTLPPEAFDPPPDVHSTVLRLAMQSRYAELGVADPQRIHPLPARLLRPEAQNCWEQPARRRRNHRAHRCSLRDRRSLPGRKGRGSYLDGARLHLPLSLPIDALLGRN